MVFINMKPHEDTDSWAVTGLYGAFNTDYKRALLSSGIFSPVQRQQAWQVELRFPFIPSVWWPYAVLRCYVISLIALFIMSFSDRSWFYLFCSWLFKFEFSNCILSLWPWDSFSAAASSAGCSVSLFLLPHFLTLCLVYHTGDSRSQDLCLLFGWLLKIILFI